MYFSLCIYLLSIDSYCRHYREIKGEDDLITDFKKLRIWGEACVGGISKQIWESEANKLSIVGEIQVVCCVSLQQ